MLTLAVLLHCLVGAGLLAMGAKYIAATPPLDYHAEITAAAPPGDEIKLILGALYSSMGGAFAALGVGTILIALTGVWADLFMAKLTLLCMAVIAGAFAAKGARHVEMQTGVRTPWRIAAGLVGLAGLAFLLSLF